MSETVNVALVFDGYGEFRAIGIPGSDRQRIARAMRVDQDAKLRGDRDSGNGQVDETFVLFKAWNREAIARVAP